MPARKQTHVRRKGYSKGKGWTYKITGGKAVRDGFLGPFKVSGPHRGRSKKR